MSIRVADLEGTQYTRKGSKIEEQDYKHFNQQYATSSHQDDHDMNPALIVRPKGDNDIKKTIKWAVEQKVAIAVKSGGHQYSGASSTGGNNIQIDLSDTYKDLTLREGANGGNPLVLAGVSNRLRDFNAYLVGHGLFIPHGQCAGVGVGGHVQSGGYGLLGRGFGLIGDHIRMIRMICHDGEVREFSLKPEQDPEMFNAVLGGSPGNFGIVTHYLIEVYRDEDYMVAPQAPFKLGGPHGIKAVWVYTPEVLAGLLDEVAEMARDIDLPQGFDMCVSVMGAGAPVGAMFEKLNDNAAYKLTGKLTEGYLKDEKYYHNQTGLPSTIILYAQWCPVNPGDKYDEKVDAWFNRFRKYRDVVEPGVEQKHKGLLFYELPSFYFPMSKMTGAWVMPRDREFPLPYVKRTHITNSITLHEDNWVPTCVERIDQLCNRKYSKLSVLRKDGLTDQEAALYDNCRVVIQIQAFGGSKSMFARNANNGTSYSWRDFTVVQVIDCFHNDTPEAKELAEVWQAENDDIMNGPDRCFSKIDKRVYWGSWGDWDMAKTWQFYFEDKEKYERIGKLRARADPHGTFTPNPFAVERVFT